MKSQLRLVRSEKRRMRAIPRIVDRVRRISYLKNNVVEGKKEIVFTRGAITSTTQKLQGLLRLRAEALDGKRKLSKDEWNDLTNNIAGMSDLILQHQRTIMNTNQLIASSIAELEKEGIRVRTRKAA